MRVLIDGQWYEAKSFKDFTSEEVSVQTKHSYLWDGDEIFINFKNEEANKSEWRFMYDEEISEIEE